MIVLSGYNLNEREVNALYAPHPVHLKLWEDENEKYYVATIPMLDGCMSDGETVKNAMQNILDAKACWLEGVSEAIDIPMPSNTSHVIKIEDPYSEEEIKQMTNECEEFAKFLSDFIEIKLVKSTQTEKG